MEFADWTPESKASVFDKDEELNGKPKDILVLKDDTVSLLHFEDKVGVQLGVKEVRKEERQHINKAYEDWKKQNRK